MGYRCLPFVHTEVTGVENLTGVVCTPWPLKFLYAKGVVAWMSGYSAGRRHFRFAEVVLYKLAEKPS